MKLFIILFTASMLLGACSTVNHDGPFVPIQDIDM